MQWSEVIEHPSLRNLPFKIETNRYGQIVMSPASNRHGLFQIAIAAWLLRLKTGGYVQCECAITTEDGVKVAGVAWYSTEFWNGHRDEIAFAAAPELCVEILSPSNRRKEITEKTELYYQGGATEVWICDEQGNMRFSDPQGMLQQSSLFPEFPAHVSIE